MSNTKKWWYHNGGQEQGPFSVAEMRALAAEFNEKTLVWKEGMANWVRAAEVDGLLADQHIHQTAATIAPILIPNLVPSGPPPSIQLQRILGYAFLLSSISIIGYFLYIQPLSMIADKSGDTVASSTVANSVSSPVPFRSSNVELVWPDSPAGTQSLYRLYGGSGTAESLPLSTGGTARVWISRRVLIGNTQKFVVLAAVELRPLKQSHADGARVDLLIYTLVNGTWVAEAPQFGVTEVGAYGLAIDTDRKAEVYALSDTETAIFIPSSSIHQGYSEGGYSILSINLNNQPRDLGWITTEEENSGACDETVADNPCWEYTSDISILPVQNNLATIQVNRHGTLKNDAGVIVPATPLVYRFNGKKYSDK